MTDIKIPLTLYRNTNRWDYYVKQANAPTDIDSVTETVERVMEHLSTHTESSIDLTNIRAENASGEHLAAVLRVTHKFRESVPGWDYGYAICISILIQESKDYRSKLPDID